ncbi:glycosyltransferase family 9 protein [Allorhodopirellula solitaria]|nr:glycosyltransferase family 9 protein [Allorhodopirellula solitaria]
MDRLVGVPMLTGLATLRWMGRRSRRESWSPRRICVYCPGANGDLMLVTSLLHTLATQTNCELLLAVSPENRHALPLIQFGQANVVSPIKKPREAARVLASESFDTLIDTHQWSRVAAMLANGNRDVFTIGFQTPHQFRHFAHDVAIPHLASNHELQNYQSLLQPFELNTQPLPPKLCVAAGENDKTRLLSERPFAVIHPWAAGYLHTLRQWPSSRWVALAHWMVDQGWQVYITGGPGDQEASLELAKSCAHSSVRSLAGELSLAEVGWLLTQSEALVSVNTGIMHLGSLLNAPTVSLNGPTNPDRWGPTGSRSMNVNPPSGKGGYLHLGFEYPSRPEEIMSEIELSVVTEAVEKVRMPPSSSASTHSPEDCSCPVN